jgi:mannosyltransferase
MRVDRRLILAGEVALAALLGFIALGSRSFWLDETASVTLAQLDWGAFVDELRVREGNMSLYHAILSVWTGIGDSEAAVRSLSVLAGVATVPIGYLLVRRLATVEAALLAGALLAVNPMLVRYMQEARSYALCALLVTGASYLFVRGVQQPNWAVWIAYAAVAALSGYAHFFALLVPPAHACSLLFVRPDAVAWRKAITAGCLLVALVLPLAAMLAANDTSGIEWTSDNPLGRLFTDIQDRPPVAAALLVAGAAVVLVAWLLARRRWSGRLQADGAWSWAFLVAWLVVPVAITIVLAVVYRPLFVVRYFIVVVPPALMLAALLVTRIRRRSMAVAAGSAFLALSLAGVVRWYATGEEENWRGATRYVVQSSRAGDGVLLFAPYVRIPFAVYLDDAGGVERAPEPVYPPDGWSTEPIRFNAFVPVSSAQVRSEAERFERVWLVSRDVAVEGGDERYDAMVDGLERAGFELRRTESFTGVGVDVYELAR